MGIRVLQLGGSDARFVNVSGDTMTGTLTVPDVELASGGPTVTTGAGSPETVVTAPPGSVYLNTSGGAGTTLYIKESGTAATGWIAK